MTSGMESNSSVGNLESPHSQSSVIRTKKQSLAGVEEDSIDSSLHDNVLSVVWAAGKLGAAYYEMETSELRLLPDIAESAPDFSILRALFSQVMPRFIIVSSRQDERLLSFLNELCGKRNLANNDANNDDLESRNGIEKPQLFIQAGREFAPDACKRRVQALRLPGEPKSHGPQEHHIYLTSLIPFGNEIMIRATGALLKFLDRSAIELLQLDLVDGHVPVLNVSICTMDELVLVDHTAWNSLQIFSLDFHPANTKQGNIAATKEGLSVYGLLNRCCSTQGSKFLRFQLLCPTRNRQILNRRFDVIEYCGSHLNTEFVRAAFDYLRSIKSIPKLLFKLSMIHISVREWKDLYQTIYHCLLLGELCFSQPQDVELFKDIAHACRSDILKSLAQEIMRVVDFEESLRKTRFSPRQGIDPELDKKRQQYACLPEVMSMVAAEEMESLPEYVQQCSVTYIPEVGYLLAVTCWREGLEYDDLQLEELEYKFTNQDLVYYKSQRMKELDIILGDCQVAILDLEMTIMLYLSENILNHSRSLIKIGQLLSELDSLLAMASVARDYNYVRPTIVLGHEKMNIENGRHPLVEQMCEFVPNTTEFNSEEKIVILTGPNASGKSIYLKQIGVLVLMALSGSFVPAVSAVIPTVDRICTRIHASESVSGGLSTFMIDINQMSLALRTTTRCSLVIVDEFGKGTAEADGLALLIATVEDFIQREHDSPTLFLSTHYYSLMEHLEDSPFLKLQTMAYMKEDDRIVYLFKLTLGTCKSSFAHLIAQNAGISETTVNRSNVIQDLVRRHLGEDIIQPIETGKKEKEDVMLSIADDFLHIDLESVDPISYLKRVLSLMEPFVKKTNKNESTSSTNSPPKTPSSANDPGEPDHISHGESECDDDDITA